jgi:hypothetical protein
MSVQVRVPVEVPFRRVYPEAFFLKASFPITTFLGERRLGEGKKRNSS